MKKLTSLLLSAVFSAGLLCTSGTLPASAAEEPLILGVNAINVTGGEGHAVLYTPAHGESVKAGTDFAWWRTATFEYSDELGAYVVVSRRRQLAEVALHPGRRLCPLRQRRQRLQRVGWHQLRQCAFHRHL